MRQSSAAGISAVTGAAATMRLFWPTSLDALVVLGTNYAGSKYNWQGGGGAGCIANAAVGTGTVTTSLEYRGRPCAQLNSPALTGNGYVINPTPQVIMMTERPAVHIIDDFACWSFRTLMAFDNPAGANAGDTGMQAAIGSVNSTQGRFNQLQQVGWALNVTGPQQLSFQTRMVNAGALVVNDVLPLPVGFDIRDWHTYDIQMVSGNPAADPYLQIFIDGVATSVQYPLTAAAAKVPNQQQGAGTWAYRVNICNCSSNVVPHAYLAQICLTAARSQGDLV